MSLRQLCERFAAWRDDSRELVLATVVATQGSTYSKPGAQMLISGTDYQGLLSGGCLEGDLVSHAERCLNERTARLVRYDMRERDEDEVWGLGLGCDGALEILLQPLSPAQAYLPFAPLAEAAMAGKKATLVLVVDSPWARRRPVAGAGAATSAAADIPGDGVVPGSAMVAVENDERYALGLTASMAAALAHHAGAVSLDARFSRTHVRVDGGGASSMLADTAPADGELDVLVTVQRPPPRLLVLGAGPDTLPLLRMSRELGWYVTQADHRPGNLAEAAATAPVDSSIEVMPEALADAVDLERFDAVVVMSHHLPSDRDYLQALATSQVPYIGLLGPAARRRRLLADVADALTANADDPAAAAWAATSLAARTHGPAGLDLGARTPAGIALSIAAEIQRLYARQT